MKEARRVVRPMQSFAMRRKEIADNFRLVTERARLG
jgi:hypothetical protein